MKKKTESQEIIKKYNSYVAKTYDNLPVVLNGGSGIWVKDIEGQLYMDFWSAYSAVNLGHANERINQVALAQIRNGALMTRACYNKYPAILGEKLSNLMDMNVMIIPKNSGAEAVETAIKTMRMYAYRVKNIPKNKAEIIVAANNFHGRTITVVSFSSKKEYKEDFGPLTPGFKIVPYNNTKAIQKAITPYTIGVLLEPIQGEGGIVVPANDYLSEVRRICDKNKILLALDEIQTGLGRTGKMFCYEYNNIKPDLLLLGKSLGGGIIPVSLLVGKKSIMKHWKPGDDGNTFGGYAMAMAVACEVLNILLEDKIPERVRRLGENFISQLKTIKSSYIKEVRGKGLLIGIELWPDAPPARKFVEKLIRKEYLICKETHKTVLRFSPPLIIGEEELEKSFYKIKRILTT